MAGEVEAAAIIINNNNTNNDADENEPYPTYQTLDGIVFRRIDPSVASLSIDDSYVAVCSLDGEELGRVIGDSTVLRRLQICQYHRNFSYRQPGWYEELFRGISRNRSIEVFELSVHPVLNPDFDFFQVLNPFFRNNSKLACIRVSSTWNKSLVSALRECDRNSQLECIELSPEFKTDYEVEAVWYLEALHDIQKLVELDLRDVRRTGSKLRAALANLLNASQIHTLSFGRLDVECIAILSHALTKKNNTLTSLRFEPDGLTTTDLIPFSRALSHPMCRLENLGLDLERASFGDEMVPLLGGDLMMTKTLKSLSFYGRSSIAITLTGWQYFSRCLSKITTLEELSLFECGIDDDSASAIVNGLIGNSSLNEIDMCNNPISIAWWESNFSMLLNCVPSLEELKLTATDVRLDDEELVVDDIMDWTDLLLTLCDSSSIDGIYSSNHTFRSIDIFESTNHEINGLPPDEIASLLLMNSSENKHEVARAKILKYYFAEGSANTLHAFSHMPLTSMPFALEWIGRCGNEISLMYNVARQLPTLFDATSHKSKCSGAERGRSEQGGTFISSSKGNGAKRDRNE